MQKTWDITDKAFSCIVDGKGIRTGDPEKSIQNSYNTDRTPSNDKMFDEYILPHIVIGYEGVLNGDSILHTNYRQDRAIQLTKHLQSKIIRENGTIAQKLNMLD